MVALSRPMCLVAVGPQQMGQSLSTSVLKRLVIQLSILAPKYHGRCLGKVIVVLIQLLKCDRCNGVNNGMRPTPGCILAGGDSSSPGAQPGWPSAVKRLPLPDMRKDARIRH